MLESSRDLLLELHTAEPVFVWSPIPGCGNDLMHELVRSSREVYVADPDPFLLHDLPYAMRVRSNAANATARPDLGDAVHDESRLCSDDTVPLQELYSTALIRGFAHVCGAYAESAHRAGFRRWGCGLPVFPSQEVAVVQGLLPRSKHVLMLRNLEDAVRANRMSGAASGDADLETMAREWSEGVLRSRGELPENLLVVWYEDLMQEPDRALPQLCEFLRVASIDLSLIDDIRHTTPEAFRHDLSPVERDLLHNTAKPALLGAATRSHGEI